MRRLAVSAFALVTVAAGAARADGAATRERVIARRGEDRAWLVIADRAPAATAAASSAAATSKSTATRTAEAIARGGRAVLARIAPETAGAELRVTEVARFGDGDAVVHFAQTYAGLPVIGRGAAVRTNARGEHVMSSVRIETAARLPASTEPAISAIDAARAAAIAPGASRFAATSIVPMGAADAHLVVWPTREGARVAYAVVPAIVPGLPTRPRVIVDAIDGRVLDARDLVVEAGHVAQTRVYPTNPIASPTLATMDLPMAPIVPASGAEPLANALVESHNCIDHHDTKPLSLGGAPINLHVCELEQRAVADASGDFLFDPVDDPQDARSREDAFSEASMYYHVTRAYEMYRGLAGDPEAQVTVDAPLRTISNLQLPHGLMQGNLASASDPQTALDPFQNAFFAPAAGGLGAIFESLYGFDAGAMWFGQGPRHDYSYDGDVVYHEFTHAVVEKTIALGQWHVDEYGLFDAPGAMNEALADYFSSALAGDPHVGEYASKDISTGLSYIRTLDNHDACPSAITGEVHYDSTLFSGGLWSARTSLPEADRTKLDAAIYKAMRTHAGDGDLDYADLAQLFVETAKVDFPAGATALEDAMTARGVLPKCDRIFDAAAGPVQPPNANVGATMRFDAPGTQTLGASVAMAPGMLQVKWAIPAGTAHVVVTFDKLPGLTASSPLAGGGAFAPVVLAKFDAPIRWPTTGALTSDATASVDPTAGDGTKMSAGIEVPAGASTIYVQIANKGQAEGAYAAVTIAADVVAPPDADAGAPAETPGASASASGGCACRTGGGGAAGAGAGSTAALVAAGGALVVAVRRRRGRGRARG